jgi:diguanylate cyclase (GGDEF)-like protein
MGRSVASLSARLWRWVDRLRTDVPRWVVVAISLVLMAVFGLIDQRTGPEVNVVTPYLLPIMLATWGAGGVVGAAVAVIASFESLAVELTEGGRGTVADEWWNAVFRLGTFLVVVWLLTRIRHFAADQQHRASRDVLTGAMSRSEFFARGSEEVERARRNGQPLALMFFDIDGLKRINDQQGHAVGDEVLRRFADAAREHLRRPDVFGRLGGDEFAVILPETDADGAEGVARRLLERLLDPAGGEPIDASIGIAGGPVDGYSLEVLVGAADEQMYAAKTAGGANLRATRLHQRRAPSAPARDDAA